jgi:hypothetical protein
VSSSPVGKATGGILVLRAARTHVDDQAVDQLHAMALEDARIRELAVLLDRDAVDLFWGDEC